MRILITGITGFIGRRLAERILSDGQHEIVGMARDLGKAKPLADQGIEIRQADLTQPDSLKGITQDVDSVVHLAALMRFHAPRELLFKNNFDATKVIAN